MRKWYACGTRRAQGVYICAKLAKNFGHKGSFRCRVDQLWGLVYVVTEYHVAAGCHFCKFVKKAYCFYKSQKRLYFRKLGTAYLQEKPSQFAQRWQALEGNQAGIHRKQLDQRYCKLNHTNERSSPPSLRQSKFHGSENGQNHGLQVRADACHVAGWLLGIL
jgi:hypothetical protein